MPSSRNLTADLYSWKSKFGGLEVSDAKRLKALEEKNHLQERQRLAWLRRHGLDGSAWHSGQLYFLDLATASQFLANFPEIVLADSTMTRSRPGRVTVAHGLNVIGSWP